MRAKNGLRDALPSDECVSACPSLLLFCTPLRVNAFLIARLIYALLLLFFNGCKVVEMTRVSLLTAARSVCFFDLIIPLKIYLYMYA